jgi:hypothetical protein
MLRSVAVFFNKLGHGIEDFLMPYLVLAHKHLLGYFGSNEMLMKYTIGFAAFALMVGVLLGWKRKISVYTSGDDVFMTFFTIVLPVLGLFFAVWVGNHAGSRALFIVCKWTVYLFEAALVATVTFNTWRVNRNPVKFAMALYTKYALATLLLVQLFIFFSSLNSNKEKYEKGEAPIIDDSLVRSILIVGFLGYMIYKMIDTDRERAMRKDVEDRRKIDALFAAGRIEEAKVIEDQRDPWCKEVA